MEKEVQRLLVTISSELNLDTYMVKGILDELYKKEIITKEEREKYG